MAELATGARQRQVWVTRSHLVAFGVTALALTVLAFFVGIRVGRSELAAPTRGPEALVPDAEEQAVLEALLREVETVTAKAAPQGSISSTLTEPPAVEPLVPVAPPVAEIEAGAPPLAPSLDAQAPSSGWSVQVGSYTAEAEAEARVGALREQGLQAYRTSALVKGASWHRVRIGGYSSKEAAEAALPELGRTLGAGDLVVAEAP